MTERPAVRPGRRREVSTVHSLRLKCDCGCAHVETHGCEVFFPDCRPIEDVGAKEIRELAGAKGWETMRHTRGRDVCPACRIVAIRIAAGIAEEGAA